MRILCGLMFIFYSVQLPAQILKNLKDKAINKVKNKAETEARNAFADELNKIRAEFDSTDFDYAILLSDNSGLFNVKDKREMGGKFLALKNIGTSLYKNSDLSDKENATLNLQVGQSAYAMGRYVFAEKRFRSAANYFKKANLINEPGYMKTISGTGLLYTTMGRFTLAEKFTSDALNMREDKFGVTDMGVAASLNNYAVLHYNLGRYN